MKKIFCLFILALSVYSAHMAPDSLFVVEGLKLKYASGVRRVLVCRNDSIVDTVSVYYDTTTKRLKGRIDSSSVAVSADTALHIGIENFPDNTLLYKTSTGAIAPCSLKTDGENITARGGVSIKGVQSSSASADSILVLQIDSSITWTSRTAAPVKNLIPWTDNTYYVGKNDDDDPAAFKGVILKDQTDGKYYRIELNSGSISIVDLTD
jgi:hypothetical protein